MDLTLPQGFLFEKEKLAGIPFLATQEADTILDVVHFLERHKIPRLLHTLTTLSLDYKGGTGRVALGH